MLGSATSPDLVVLQRAGCQWKSCTYGSCESYVEGCTSSRFCGRIEDQQSGLHTEFETFIVCNENIIRSSSTQWIARGLSHVIPLFHNCKITMAASCATRRILLSIWSIYCTKKFVWGRSTGSTLLLSRSLHRISKSMHDNREVQKYFEKFNAKENPLSCINYCP